jgi:tripartite-type tricarboxylate transporter receptor subunit TctC
MSAAPPRLLRRLPRRLSRRLLLAGLPALAAGAAAAQPATPAYPVNPVTLVVPFSAGGAADIAARLLAAHAGRHLPNRAATLLVENRPGASGALGTHSVQRSSPDGQTLLLARTAPAAILPATDPRTPYGWDEFAMLGLLEENPFVVAVRADAPWRSLAELITALREHPGTLHFPTTGPATLLDLGVRKLFVLAGLPIDAGIALPFRGGGEAVAAVQDGRAQFIGNNLSDTLPAIAAGQLRALVVGTAQRLPALPRVPTAAEAEVPDLVQVTGWSALFGPPGLPEEVVEAWTRALAALRTDRGWQEATRRAGSIPRLLDPAGTRGFVAAQVTLYRELAKRLGLS